MKKTFDIVKKFLIADLAIGLLLTVIAWTTLGTEGMAAKFCNLTHAARCDEIEWSEKYDRTRDPQQSRPDEETQGYQEKTPRSREDYHLRFGL